MQGLIHIYHGQGKGKTTAAVGLCVRALGRDKKVLFVQFMKSWDSGELHILTELPYIQIMRSKPSNKFSFQMNEQERAECRINNDQFLEKVVQVVQTEQPDLLVLDELIGTYDKNLIDRTKVLELLRNKPHGLEIVMTGRNPHEELLAMADYVTEMLKQKHPFDQGIVAREGIEK